MRKGQARLPRDVFAELLGMVRSGTAGQAQSLEAQELDSGSGFCSAKPVTLLETTSRCWVMRPQLGYLMCTPEMARAMINLWISLVPSKMV